MVYLTVDAMISGTGVRDSYSGLFFELDDLRIGIIMQQRISEWLKLYRVEHYSGFQDIDKVKQLDKAGVEIASALSQEIACKVEYYSSALCRKIAISELRQN